MTGHACLHDLILAEAQLPEMLGEPEVFPSRLARQQGPQNRAVLMANPLDTDLLDRGIRGLAGE